MSSIIAYLISAYLIGMIPFGEIYAYLFGIGTLKNKGSGNIGATNAYRIGGKLLGLLTLASDVLKGLIPVLISRNEWVALAPILGHIRFPFFKGGKGVATALGAFTALNPLIPVILIPIWIGIFKWKKISSLASIITFAILPFISYYLKINIFISLIASLVILYAHRDNIMRLWQGAEKPL